MRFSYRMLAVALAVALPTAVGHGQESLPKGAVVQLGSKPAIRTTSAMTGMVVLPDGKQVVTADAKGISVWDLESGRLVASSPVPKKPVPAKNVGGNPFRTPPITVPRSDPAIRVSVHHAQGALALGADGKSVILTHRDPLQPREFLRYSLPLDPAETPASYGDTTGLDPTAAIVPAADSLFGLSVRGRLGELRGGTRTGRLSIPPVAGEWLAIASGGGIVAFGGEDERVRIWDAANNKNLGHVDTAAVRAVAVSADGRTLVTSSLTPLPRVDGNSGSTVVWSLPGRKEISRWPDASSVLAVTADGKRVAMVDEPGRIRLFESATGRQVQEMGQPGTGCMYLDFSKDGSALVAGTTTNEIHVFNLETGKLRKEKTGHSAAITGVHILPTGEILTAGADGFIRIWDGAGKELRKFQCEERGINAVLVSEDGNTAFTAGGVLEPRVRAWDIAKGEKLREHAQNRNEALAPYSLASNGKVLAAGFVASGIHLLDPQSFKPIGKLSSGRISLLHDVVFAANGRIVAREATSYVVWDSRKSEIVKTIATSNPLLPAGNVNYPRLGVSPDGSRFAATNSARTGKSVVGVWKTDDGSLVENIELTKAGPLLSVCYHPDGKTIAVSDVDGRVWLVDTVLKGEPLLLHGHDGPVFALAFTKDGRKLISGGSDTTAVIWNLPEL